MDINIFKNGILNNWLEVDFDNTFSLLGFGKKAQDISEKLIFDTIRCLDHETTMKHTPSVNYVVTLIALMWEYADVQKYDLRKIIIKFLSRLGYPTSAIIVDKEFDSKNCKFMPLESKMEQLLVVLNQEPNSIQVQEHQFLLTNFQMEIWNSMDTERLIGISAPTSAGKSFVILLKLIEKLSKENFDIVYIIPTLSLLNQVSEDFSAFIKKIGIGNCKVVNSFSEHRNNDNHIYVLTQEKAIAAFSEKTGAFSEKMVLVVDEIQNIERIKEDNDERAKVLYDTLNEFRYRKNVSQIILSGPRIEGVEKVGEHIFGLEAKDITSIDSPVLNLTYSILKNKSDYYLKQYSALSLQPITKRILNSDSIMGYGQQKYNESYLSFLNIVVSKLRGQQNIIFSPTAATARKIAGSLTGESVEFPEIEELIAYYQESVHSSYSMCNILSNGIAYHHGKLPAHVRCTIEKAIHEKWIYNIACTTTLLQGVNLPAQNIIIRNPHLYLRKRRDAAELSNYEMANLRGRAGRLLKDFIGRTFVLDETSFVDTDGYEQTTLFDNATKELPTSYEERYDKHQEAIEEAILSNEPTGGMQGYGDLVAYIRQSILKYGESARQRMKNVGISLTKEQVAAIALKLKSISVSKDVCAKNRYWDPFVLDAIFKGYHEDVPAHPLERGCKAKIDRMLKFLRDTEETKAIYGRDIPVLLQKSGGRGLLVDLCMQWAKGDPLSKILEKKCKKEEKADEIEDIIEILQNTVSYKVPLLLKPIFDMKNPNSSVLTCMQAGTYNPITKKIIELGVPRECALFLNEKLFTNEKNDKIDEVELEDFIRSKLRSNMSQLPFWIKVQVEFLD